MLAGEGEKVRQEVENIAHASSRFVVQEGDLEFERSRARLRRGDLRRGQGHLLEDMQNVQSHSTI